MRYENLSECSGNLHAELSQEFASFDDVKKFLRENEFDGYMGVELPHGLKVPGKALSETADAVFKYSVKGKRLLDVGCRYGYFCHQAILRGASEAVGVEMDQKYAHIATEISKLWGRKIIVLCQDLRSLDASLRYDVTLLLNLLHHLVSPVDAMAKLGEITKEMMIVEFATLFSPQIKTNLMSRFFHRVFSSGLPLAYIGSTQYHRTWYFSKSAFVNLFVKQMNLFKKIEFRTSPRKKGRMLAYCWRNPMPNEIIV